MWRKTTASDSWDDAVVYTSIPCAIVPISQFDSISPFFRESTHVVWIPNYIVMRKEDQLKVNGQAPTPEGDNQPIVYTVDGRGDFRLGMTEIIYFVRAQD